MEDQLQFDVELVEKELINVEIIEKEIIKVNLKTLDLIPRKVYIWELEDIAITNKQNLQVFVYDENLKVWVNKYITDLLKEYTITEEPIKINNSKFQLTYTFISSLLEVYLNGIKTIKIINKDENAKTFEFEVPVLNNATVECKYVKQP